MKKNDKYGLLTAIEPIYVDINNKLIKTDFWKFRCDCGNEYVGKISRIISGNTKSCGCLLIENSLKNAINSLDYIDGTCVQKIASETIYKNNKSGVKGVGWNNGKKLWEAHICFKGEKYKKYFKNKDNAIKYRKKMEEKLFKPFIEEYISK